VALATKCDMVSHLSLISDGCSILRLIGSNSPIPLYILSLDLLHVITLNLQPWVNSMLFILMSLFGFQFDKV
jgi:hypothetical protein